MTSYQITSFLSSNSVINHFTSIVHQVQKPTHVFVLPFCFSAINSYDILQKWVTEKRNWSTKMEAQQRNKNGIMLEVKFDLNINGVIEEIADCQNVDAVVIQEALAMQLVDKQVLNLQIFSHQI